MKIDPTRNVFAGHHVVPYLSATDVFFNNCELVKGYEL